MAQQRAKFTTVDFRGGLNTDASPLSYPEESVRKNNNFVVGYDGSLQRRLGLQSIMSRELPVIDIDGSPLDYLDLCRSGKVSAAVWKTGSSASPDYIVVNYGGRIIEFYNIDDIRLPTIDESLTLAFTGAQAVPVPRITVFKNQVKTAVGSSYSLAPSDIDTIVIDTSGNNINLRSTFVAETNSQPKSDTTVEFVIQSGKLIGSTSTDEPALRTGEWPSGSTLLITNNGTILGRGGNGGRARPSKNSEVQYDGAYGGNAILIERQINFFDNQGLIAAGGGGGGGASDAISRSAGIFDTKYNYAASGGGGGAGAVSSSGGGTDNGPTKGGSAVNNSGTGGDKNGPGRSTLAENEFDNFLFGTSTARAKGGDGGDVGEAGENGTVGYTANGGDAGTAIVNYSDILDDNFSTNPPVGDTLYG